MRMRTAKQLIGTFDTTCPVRVSEVDPQLTMKVPVEHCRPISEPLFSDGVNNRTETDAGGDETGANLRLADDTVEIERSKTINDDDEMKICQFTRTDPDTDSSQPHHIQPLADRGADDGSNIDPMFADDHTKHHQDDGDFKRWGRRGGRTCTASDPLDQE